MDNIHVQQDGKTVVEEIEEAARLLASEGIKREDSAGLNRARKVF